MYAKKNSGKKVIVLLLAIVMLIGCAIGGTVAYLTTKTDAVVNTFVAGNIGTLELDESDTTTQTADGKNIYIIIPGKDITKDPKITYTPATTNDVGNVYIFVEVAGGSWKYDSASSKFVAGDLSWTVASGWQHLKDNVFYMTTAAPVSDQAFIANNTISVANTITKDTMANAVTNASGLTFTAYAIQAEGFTGASAAADAWAAVK